MIRTGVRRFVLLGVLLLVPFTVSALARQSRIAVPVESSQTVSIPRLITFGGTLRDRNDQALSGTVGLTLAIYKDQTGGAPLWMETQNVQVDPSGHYTVLLGAAKPEGLPMDLFTSGEPHWLGVTVQTDGEPEQPRLLLSSVPYALEAADAQTLGGKPLSAFVLTEPNSIAAADGPNSKLSVHPMISGAGSANLLSKWIDNAGTLGNSAITEVNGNVGIGTPNPTQALTVNGSVRVVNNQVFGFESTTPGTNAGRFYADTNNNMVFETNSGSSSMLFQTTGGPVGIGTSSAAGKLEVDVNDTTAYSPTMNGSSQSVAVAPQTFDTLFLNNPKSGANFNSILFSNGSSGVGTGRIGLVQDGVRGGAFSFMTRSSSDFNMHEQMRITNLGNVGIGTTTPAGKLEVAGNVVVSGNGVITGNGSGLTNLNAANLVGTISSASISGSASDTPSTLVSRDASGNFSAGTITAAAFAGNGAALTNVGAVTLGGQPASSYARTDQGNTLTGTQRINGAISVANSGYEQLSMDSSGNLVALGSLYVGTGNFVTATGSDLLVGQATNGSTIANVFRVDSTGKGYFNGSTQTSGADFAESFDVLGQADGYEPGDVLAIDSTGNRRLALASGPYSTLVAGIYSTKPGVLATPHNIDQSLADEVPLAVVGVVPCKVTDENGPIHAGDLLVTSSTPGYAMRGSERDRMLGAVVGKALESLASGKSVIQVLVTLQ